MRALMKSVFSSSFVFPTKSALDKPYPLFTSWCIRFICPHLCRMVWTVFLQLHNNTGYTDLYHPVLRSSILHHSLYNRMRQHSIHPMSRQTGKFCSNRNKLDYKRVSSILYFRESAVKTYAVFSIVLPWLFVFAIWILPVFQGTRNNAEVGSYPLPQ